MADFGTGIAAAIKEKKFTSYKIPRVLLGLVFGTLLLAIAHNVSLHSIVFKPLPQMVLVILYSQNIISICENLGRLEVLNKNAVEFIKSKVSFKKTLRKRE